MTTNTDFLLSRASRRLKELAQRVAAATEPDAEKAARERLGNYASLLILNLPAWAWMRVCAQAGLPWLVRHPQTINPSLN